MWNMEQRGEGVELPFETCNNDLDVGGRVILKWTLKMLPV